MTACFHISIYKPPITDNMLITTSKKPTKNLKKKNTSYSILHIDIASNHRCQKKTISQSSTKCNYYNGEM